MKAFAAQAGFNLKADPGSIENLGFCGRWYMMDGGYCVSMADLPRALAKIHVSCANIPKYTRKYAEGLLRAKALSLTVSDRDTPIIAAWCASALSLTRHARAKWVDREVAHKWASGIVESRCHARRQSLLTLIACRLGLSTSDIERIENNIRTVGIWGDLEVLDWHRTLKVERTDEMLGDGACAALF